MYFGNGESAEMIINSKIAEMSRNLRLNRNVVTGNAVTNKGIVDVKPTVTLRRIHLRPRLDHPISW